MQMPSDEPFTVADEEQDLVASFVQDKQGVTLPSFDDFRRRDETQGAVPERRRTPPGEQTAQEKLFELLTFDTIDDRAERSDEMEYDMTARLIGRGTASKGGAYLLPYFQTGHILLLGVLLLSATVSYPGFPLTTLPDEYRDLIKEGLVLNYLVNAACAVYSRGIAAEKGEPVNFWFGKILLLGGLALGELTQAVPGPNSQKPRYPNQR
jgi:hypothetical protein